MNDTRRRGPETDERRIERNPARPYENKPPKPTVPERVRDILDNGRSKK